MFSASARLILSEPPASVRKGRARQGLDDLVTGRSGRKPIHPQHLVRLISEHATENAVFTFDIGTPSIWVVR